MAAIFPFRTKRPSKGSSGQLRNTEEWSAFTAFVTGTGDNPVGFGHPVSIAFEEGNGARFVKALSAGEAIAGFSRENIFTGNSLSNNGATYADGDRVSIATSGSLLAAPAGERITSGSEVWWDGGEGAFFAEGAGGRIFLPGCVYTQDVQEGEPAIIGFSIAPDAEFEPVDPTVPGIVNSLSAAAGDQQIILSWNAPSSGGSPITDYLIQYKEASSETWLTWSHPASSATVATIAGLSNGTEYQGRVYAINGIGQQTTSSNIASATPATIPSAPTLSATAGDGVVTISWTDGANGGSAITARRLYRSTVDGFTPGSGNLLATSPSFPYADTSVSNGTTYYYKGVSDNVMGESPASSQVSATPASAALPSWTVQPSISGIARVGEVLAGNDGTVVNGTVTSRAWLRDDSPIPGASGTTYTLVEADIDCLISYRSSATGPGGTASAESTPVGPVEPSEGRVIIDVNGAGTGLTAQNAAEFPGATWQWYTGDGSPISGQTTTTLLFTNLPDGAAAFLRANADPGTDSAKFIKPRDTTIVAFDAADEADGPLAGLFPQIPTASAGIEFDDGKLVTNTGSEAAFIAELGTTAQRVDVELLFGDPANYGESTSTDRQFGMIYTNSSNCMFVSVRGGFIEFTKVAGGSPVYDIIPKVFDQNKDGDIFTIELEPGTGTELFLRVTRNGVRVEGSPGKGFNINSIGNVLTPSTKVRYEGPSSTGTANPSWPIANMASFKASAIVPSPVVVQAVDFVDPTIEAPAQIEFSGTSETALVLEAMISEPNGKTVVPFTEFTLSATGAFSGLSLPLPESMHGAPGGYILRVRDKSDIDSYSDYIIGNVPNWRPIDPNFMLGINTGAISSAYPLIFADLTEKIRWVYGTVEGYQLNYIEGVAPPTPPLGANGNPTGYIEDEGWNYPGQNARLIMPVLIEGDGTKHSDFAQGGNVMPYGTGGAWEFKYNGAPGDFEFQGLGFAGAASPFSGFVAKANGFTCNVTENGPSGNVTTWFKIKPTLAGGRGVANPNGIDISMRKVGDTTNELLLPSVKAAYGREKFIRPMHPQMESFRPLRPSYPFVGSKWADMDHAIRLAQGYGPQAVGWMCQAPLYTETSPGNDIIDPFQCVRKTFEKMAIDRAKLFAKTSYTNDFIWEPGNEVFNWYPPYAVYNRPFADVADAFGFFSGMASGDIKIYAQKYAGASWFSKMAHEFFNNGTVPDLTSYGFPDLSDLANPAQALNGRVKTIVSVRTGESIKEIKSWFDEIGGPGGIWAIAPNSYFMTKPDNDATLVDALDANNQPAAIARIHEMLLVTSAQLIATLKQSSLAYREAYPNIEMITYEGRWHNDPEFSTVLRLNRYLAASNAYRKTVDYKNIEKSVIRACIEAGFKGMADFVQYEGFADKSTDETRRQNFGIMSDAGKFIDPATAADQMAQIARLEMHDLIDSM